MTRGNLTITVARKPLPAGATVASNALVWGTGGINIDPSRIASCETPAADRRKSTLPIHYTGEGRWKDRRSPEVCHQERPGEQLGRWPANLILVHNAGCLEAACEPTCPCRVLDEQSGVLTSGSVRPGYMKNSSSQPSQGGIYEAGHRDYPLTGFGDTGGASRFFLQVWRDSDEG